MTKKQYLYWVGRELRDLPWKTRRSLLADLDSHLDEAPLDRFRPPQAYAAELRASAGLGRQHGPVAYLRARRPRNLALVVLALVVAALLAVGFTWVQSYQPLAIGAFGLRPDGSTSGALGEDVVVFHDGAPFRFGFSVRNEGSFGVRIASVPLTGILPFSARLFVSGPLERAREIPGPTTPFKPFDLEPGQDRMVILRGVFDHCRDYAASTAVRIVSMPVRMSFLWRAETVDVSLNEPLVIQVPGGRRCVR